MGNSRKVPVLFINLFMIGKLSVAQVGIGTTSPSGMLHITPVSSSAIIIDPYNTASGNTGEIQFKELSGNGSNYIGFKAPDDISSNLTFTLPNADGTNGQTLSTNGSNVLSWTDSGNGIWEEIGRTSLASASDEIIIGGTPEGSASFSDDFSGSDNWTDHGNASNNQIYVDVTTDQIIGEVSGANVNYGTAYDLGTGNVSDTEWILRMKMHFTTISGTTAIFSIGLHDNASGDVKNVAQDFIGCYFDAPNSGQICGIDNDNASNFTCEANSTNAYSAGDTRYLEIKRTSATTYEYSMYSDVNYTSVVVSGSSSCASTIQNLRYIRINSEAGARVGDCDFEIDDVQFWNGQSAAGFPARKHLMLLSHVIDNGITQLDMTFNGDLGANYARRYSALGGSDVNNINYNWIGLNYTSPVEKFAVLHIINDPDQEKLVIGHEVDNKSSGAGNAPNRLEFVGKWTNTSDPITSIKINNASAGDWMAGSEVVLLGFKNEFSCGGTLHDDRDGKEYSTLFIGGNTSPHCLSGGDKQCWMGENLNYGTRINGASNQTDNGVDEKYCYDDLESNCDTDGGLYQWDELMKYGTSVSGNGPGPQGICPDGWHIPTDNEVKCLEMNIGMTQAQADLSNTWRNTANEGTQLLQGGSSGFEILPVGFRNHTGTFVNAGTNGRIFSSTDDGGTRGWNREFNTSQTGVYRTTEQKIRGLSVRCVKD